MRIASRQNNKRLAVIGIIFAVIALLATAIFATINASLFAASMPTPSSLSPAGGLYTNGKSYTMRWTPIASAVKYTYESYNDELGKSKRFESTELSSSSSRSGIGEMTYYWRVQAIDAQGNKSEWSELSKLVIDNTPPTSPSISVSGIGVEKLLNTPSITATWNQPTGDSASYNFRYSNTAIGAQYTAQSPRNITGLTATEWSGPISEGDGAYTLQVQALDRAGNQSPWSAPFTFNLDVTAPGITLDPIASAETPAIITVRAAVNDSSIQKAEILVDGTVITEVDVTDGKVVHSLSGYGAGTRTITVRATDAAGNRGVSNAQTSIITTPVVIITPTPPEETPTSKPTQPTIPVEIEEPAPPVLQPTITDPAPVKNVPSNASAAIEQPVRTNNLRNIAFALPDEEGEVAAPVSAAASAPETSISGGLTNVAQGVKGDSVAKNNWSVPLGGIGWGVAAGVGVSWAILAVRRRWPEDK